MKRFKSELDKLIEKGIIGKPVKTVDHDPDWYRKHIEAERKAEEEAQLKEQKRINGLECPSCKSTNKKHVVKRNDNVIIGPGYSSWVIEEYFVCKECGIMYKDLTKLKKE